MISKEKQLIAFEEKIDLMIREKSRLAEDIIGSGEDWLGSLGVSELRELVALEDS